MTPTETTTAKLTALAALLVGLITTGWWTLKSCAEGMLPDGGVIDAGPGEPQGDAGGDDPGGGVVCPDGRVVTLPIECE